jgi:hypothetical protein
MRLFQGMPNPSTNEATLIAPSVARIASISSGPTQYPESRSSFQSRHAPSALQACVARNDGRLTRFPLSCRSDMIGFGLAQDIGVKVVMAPLRSSSDSLTSLEASLGASSDNTD